MKGCFIPLIGRFGNQCIAYLFAKGYAERNGLELHTPRWAGEKIFQIEPTPEKGQDDLILGGYGQNPNSLAAYTRKQAKEWLKFKPEIEEKLALFTPPEGTVVAHLRRGDYAGYGFPVISKESYIKAARHFGFELDSGVWILFASEEHPLKSDYLSKLGMSFLPDFHFMMKASILFRANSSFSWVAGMLGNGRVFSPRIIGLKGGIEHDVEFFKGNNEQLSEMADCGPMTLKEE